MIHAGQGRVVLTATLTTFFFCALQNITRAERLHQLSNTQNASATGQGKYLASQPVAIVMHETFKDSQENEIEELKGSSTEKNSWQHTSTDYGAKKVIHRQGPHGNSTEVSLIKQLGDTLLSEEQKHEATCILTFWTYVFVRKRESEPLIAVAVNTGFKSETVCLKQCGEYSLPDYMLVIGSSDNSGFVPGYKFYLSDTSGPPCSLLPPGSSVTLSTEMRPANQGNCHLLYIPLLLLSIVCARLVFKLNHP